MRLKNWAAVKELRGGYYNQEALLFITFMVTLFNFLIRNLEGRLL